MRPEVETRVVCDKKGGGMKVRIFLTGISGYLGRVLTEHLARMPEVEQIVGIDVVPPAYAIPPNVNFVKKDIRDPDLAGVMAGCNVVVHTAFIVLWPARIPEAERNDINLNGARNVAKAALACGAKKFLHISSQAAYDARRIHGQMNVKEDFPLGRGDSGFYYWDGKALIEKALGEILGQSGVTLSIFRPSYVIGPRNLSTIEGWRRNAARFPGRVLRAQFVHEDDMAEAFVQAVRVNMPGAYNCVPDDVITMSRFFQLIGKKFVPVVPVSMARLVMAVRWRYFGSMEHPSWLDASLLDFKLSNEKLKAAGWKPRFNCEEAIRAAL